MHPILSLSRLGWTTSSTAVATTAGHRVSNLTRLSLLLSTVHVDRYGGSVSQTRPVSFGRDGNYKEKKHGNDDLPTSAQTRELEHPG
jgi:hypothetical protein